VTYIKFHNTAVQRYHNDEYMPDDYWIEPSEEGVAQVTQEVADELIDANIADPYDNE